MNDKLPDSEKDEKQSGQMADLPMDIFESSESVVPLEDLKIPEAAAPATANLKPKMNFLLAITKTKIDMDAVNNVTAAVNKKVGQLLHKTVSEKAHRAAPGQVTLKQVNDYRLASPCGQKWDEMVGKDNVRSCEKCKLKVYDFAGMDQAEAEDKVQKIEGTENPVLYKRADGKFLTAECPVGKQAKFLKRVPLAVAGLLAATVIVAMFVAPPSIKSPTVSDTGTTPTGTTEPSPTQPAESRKQVVAVMKHDPELEALVLASNKEKVTPLLERDAEHLKAISAIEASRAQPVQGIFEHKKRLDADLNVVD